MMNFLYFGWELDVMKYCRVHLIFFNLSILKITY